MGRGCAMSMTVSIETLFSVTSLDVKIVPEMVRETPGSPPPIFICKYGWLGVKRLLAPQSATFEEREPIGSRPSDAAPAARLARHRSAGPVRPRALPPVAA